MSVYTVNANGISFTREEANDFTNGKGYHGKDGCYYCPYNSGHEQGASRIAGPCGQQNCWIDINCEEEC